MVIVRGSYLCLYSASYFRQSWKPFCPADQVAPWIRGPALPAAKIWARSVILAVWFSFFDIVRISGFLHIGRNPKRKRCRKEKVFIKYQQLKIRTGKNRNCCHFPVSLSVTANEPLYRYLDGFGHLIENVEVEFPVGLMNNPGFLQQIRLDGSTFNLTTPVRIYSIKNVIYVS